ncbi:MAG: DUF3500 domain-containing protein [candidate division Zixibacteria bacterium]|nr:DUF3500 domain-containing protein [candidate division Zixibacteria bacterium]
MSDDHNGLLTSKHIQGLVQRMGEAAASFTAVLAPDQRAKALFPFEDDDARTFWDYVPLARKGLPLGEMDRGQRRRAMQLVATGLSGTGYATTTTIMGLEATLDAREGWSSGNWRDPSDYYVSLFGTPSDQDPWGWKFEGHHVSINYTIAGGKIVAPTPFFFGANPASAALNGVSSLRPLGNVEDLARELVRALDEEQRHSALIAAVPPGDIVTVNQRIITENREKPDRLARTDVPYDAVRYTETPRGLAGAGMNDGQREMLEALIGEYIHRMPDAVAEIESDLLRKHGVGDVHLAWAGGLEARQPHYYRLQGGRFLVEYDNVQNDANHVHTVWRNPTNDFGADLLAHHYHTAHDHGVEHRH